MNRDKIIIRTSIIGIIANVFLAGFKAAVGLLANSIAIVLDAVNNLSDALSSVITIIGTRLAGKRPDKKHPLGHGRIEYLSAMIVSAIVLYAGIVSMVESIKKIINPVDPEYSKITLIVVASAIVVKLLLGRYVKSMGQKVNSGPLIASGSDALYDAIISISVFVSAIIYMTTELGLEAFVGVIISIFIIKSGIGMLMDAVDEILGKRPDEEYLAEIRRTLCEDEQVHGAYDLILHSYGPDHYIGSVHVEIPDTMTAEEIDTMERDLAAKVYEKHGVLLGGIGIYTLNTGDDELKKLRSDITHLVMSHSGVLQLHGFHYDKRSNTISFDIILDYDLGLEERKSRYEKICDDVKKHYNSYNFNIQMDIDI